MGKIWSKKKTFARQFSMDKKNPKLRNNIFYTERWQSNQKAAFFLSEGLSGVSHY